MKQRRPILSSAFFLCLLGMAFCVWCTLGNDVNLCVSDGCSLYQDFTLAGFSLWWLGAGAFTFMGIIALLGFGGAGAALSGLCLLGDIGLLALMALTAPCISCLIVATIFALVFMTFRNASAAGKNRHGTQRHSLLAWAWLILFIVNVGAVLRSYINVWPILGEEELASTRMFFSPSCSYCAEGIDILSGNVDVAFYPIAENGDDLSKIIAMQRYLNDGMSLAEALGKAREEVEAANNLSNVKPDALLMRFRLLRNKAHVLAAGSQGVPFFEHRGLPRYLQVPKNDRVKTARPGPPPLPRSPADPTLPRELTEGQCSGGAECN